MRRFASILTLLGCLAFVAGCGGETEESDNPVDKNVPEADVQEDNLKKVDPATLMNGGGDSDDGDADTENGETDDSQNDGLVQPDLNAPPNTGPTLEPPKLRDPTKSGGDDQ